LVVWHLASLHIDREARLGGRLIANGGRSLVASSRNGQVSLLALVLRNDPRVDDFDSGNE